MHKIHILNVPKFVKAIKQIRSGKTFREGDFKKSFKLR